MESVAGEGSLELQRPLIQEHMVLQDEHPAGKPGVWGSLACHGKWWERKALAPKMVWGGLLGGAI